jgi:hypothetical protein
MSRLAAVFIAILGVLALQTCQCGSKPCPFPDGGCPNDLPDSCPTNGGPSYKTQVAPLLQEYCVNCHCANCGTGQPIGEYSWLSSCVDGGSCNYGVVLGSIYSCYMPPADGGAPKLNVCDRETVLQWLVCGAPNN